MVDGWIRVWSVVSVCRGATEDRKPRVMHVARLSAARMVGVPVEGRWRKNGEKMKSKVRRTGAGHFLVDSRNDNVNTGDSRSAAVPNSALVGIAVDSKYRLVQE